MSEASTGEDVEVVNSTLTELVLLLAFLFMLISVVLAIKLNDGQGRCNSPNCVEQQAVDDADEAFHDVHREYQRLKGQIDIYHQLAKPSCFWDPIKLKTKTRSKSIDALFKITQKSGHLHVEYWAKYNNGFRAESAFKTITGSKPGNGPTAVTLSRLISGANKIQSKAIGKEGYPCNYYARITDDAVAVLSGPEYKKLSIALPNF